MIKFYVQMIKQGKMTLEEVPEKWRQMVKEALENKN